MATITRNFSKRLRRYTETTAPDGGCNQGNHSRHWIGCRYCEANRTSRRWYQIVRNVEEEALR